MDLESGLIGFGADMRVDLTLDEAGGLLAEVGEEGVEIGLGTLGFEHDGAIGLVSDPSGDGQPLGTGSGPHAEADALDSALKDDALAGDHEGDCSG